MIGNSEVPGGPIAPAKDVLPSDELKSTASNLIEELQNTLGNWPEYTQAMKEFNEKNLSSPSGSVAFLHSGRGYYLHFTRASADRFGSVVFTRVREITDEHILPGGQLIPEDLTQRSKGQVFKYNDAIIRISSAQSGHFEIESDTDYNERQEYYDPARYQQYDFHPDIYPIVSPPQPGFEPGSGKIRAARHWPIADNQKAKESISKFLREANVPQPLAVTA